MYLAHARLLRVGPFGETAFPFLTPERTPRMITVVHGAGGVGKTLLLTALGSTRPGHAVVLPVSPAGDDASPLVIADWILGADDPERPHALSVMTPHARPPGADDQVALRRREQALFDRKARAGGFVFVALSSMRWFSRQPVALHAPMRTVARYDVRNTGSFDDATRSDLTRDTKQALAYAALSAALVPNATAGNPEIDNRLLGAAMFETVDTMVRLAGFRYEGLEPRSLEPVFSTTAGRCLGFDGLPTRVRHLVAFAALPVRTLWAAYPGRDPRNAEGVVAIDEVDLHQDGAVQEQLVPALVTALPRVQWILTTSSPIVAGSCDRRQVLALRRLPEDDQVALFLGEQATTH